jgi:hypothetical protein
MAQFKHRFESYADVAAAPRELFEELDDHERLSSHMMKSSAMMAGSAMRFEFDEQHGRAVGSQIRLYGTIMGLRLEVTEAVSERDLPRRKVWETVEEPHLLVIGRYRMGFEIEPGQAGSRLRVFIDYDDPAGAWHIGGKLLGGIYARWCTRNMVSGAVARFAR